MSIPIVVGIEFGHDLAPDGLKVDRLVTVFVRNALERQSIDGRDGFADGSNQNRVGLDGQERYGLVFVSVPRCRRVWVFIIGGGRNGHGDYLKINLWSSSRELSILLM